MRMWLHMSNQYIVSDPGDEQISNLNNWREVEVLPVSEGRDWQYLSEEYQPFVVARRARVYIVPEKEEER